jgi:hypothetical protein
MRDGTKMNHDNDKHSEPGHEMTDVSISGLVKFLVVLTVSTIVIFVAMKYYTDFLEGQEEQAELPPASRVNPPGVRRLPPLPRLQGAPGSEALPLDEMKQYREQEQAALTSYSWVDKGTGVVRIPIEEAKKIILEKGMPVPSPTAAAAKGK